MEVQHDIRRPDDAGQTGGRPGAGRESPPVAPGPASLQPGADAAGNAGGRMEAVGGDDGSARMHASPQ
ncbi:MAG: hypothetical protein GX571_08975, partial [Lentisphaerae bacterium]|nr:hypothetical protein [Lentisphaerota bacterium]